MSAENKATIPDDEIDLRSIGGRVYSFIASPLSLLFSNIKIMLCFVATAVILSIGIRYLVPRTYTSSFIIRSTDIKDKMYLKVLADLPALLKKKEYDALSQELRLNDSVVSSLTDISVASVSTKNFTDSLNCTEIVIETKNYQNFITIQNGILNYLENNLYYLKIKNLQKKQIDLGLEEINKDLAQLDSLKKLQLLNYGKQSVSNLNTIPLTELYDPTASYAMANQRNEKKLNLIAQSVFLDRFQLIKPCAIFKNHSSPPRISILLLYLIPIFLFLCVIFLFIKTYRIRNKTLS